MTQKEWFQTFFDKHYVGLLKAQTTTNNDHDQVDFIEEKLQLRPPARILDVACGFGRHSIALAKRGYQVVGIDYSPAMLTEARRQLRTKLPVSFQHADMRCLPFNAEFDVVINMFTSFGYFSHKENLLALRKMSQALKPGGLLLLDVLDRKFIAIMQKQRGEHFRWWWPVGKSYRIMEELNFDTKQGIICSNWYILQKEGRLWRQFDKQMELRVYFRAQWKQMLLSSDLKLKTFIRTDSIKTTGKQGGSRLVVIAQKISKQK